MNEPGGVGPLEIMMARALKLDDERGELEAWQTAPLAETEISDAAELGVPIPDDEIQQLLPTIRLVVRHDIAQRRTLLALAPGEIDRDLARLTEETP